jgi:hypothetical protein
VTDVGGLDNRVPFRNDYPEGNDICPAGAVFVCVHAGQLVQIVHVIVMLSPGDIIRRLGAYP